MRANNFYLTFTLLSAFALTSCGIRGSLETAPPVFGTAKAKYEAEKAAKAEEEKRKAEEAKSPKAN